MALLRPPDLRAFLAKEAETRPAVGSQTRTVAALKVFFRYLQLEGVLKENLVELLGSQKLWQRVPEVLSPQAVNKMLAGPTAGEVYWRREHDSSNCRNRTIFSRVLYDHQCPQNGNFDTDRPCGACWPVPERN